MNRGRLGIFFTLICLSNLSLATTFIELQSSYLGDGWFRYRMQMPYDPFFRKADVGDIAITSFTNFAEFGPAPQDWTNQPSSGNSAAWRYALPIPSQTRPYVREFLVRSDEHTFRVGTNAMVVMSLELVSDWFDYWADHGAIAQNIVGYAHIPCLIPCSPQLADNSPTNFTAILEIVDHDLTLDSLIVTNGEVNGVTFSAAFKSTVLLEGTFDHRQWTNIAYLWGNAGATTWRTNIALNDFGSFFRLELVAMNEHVTNLPPLNTFSSAAKASKDQPATVVRPAQTSVQVQRCFPEGEEMVVKFNSQTGVTYGVSAMGMRGTTLCTQDVAGTGAEAEARFNTTSLPNTVWFKVEAAK